MSDYIDADDYDDGKYMPKYVTMRVCSVTNLYNGVYSVTAESLEKDIVLDFIADKDDIDKGYKFHITFDWD